MMSDSKVFNPAFLLRRYAASFPDKKALIYPTGKNSDGKIIYASKSYREIEQESDRAAYVLQRAGFSQGDKTVFMVKPGPELFSLMFGLFKVGAIPVVVDPGMGIRRMLHCYRAVGAETFIGIPLATAVRLFTPRTFSSIRSAVTISRGAIVGEDKCLKGVSLGQPFSICVKQQDDIALINFTTGSTGPAKGVECTHGMIKSVMELIQAHYGFKHDDVQLLTAPFLGLLGIMMGNTCVLPKMDPTKPAEIYPPFILDAIEQHHVTTLFASPALLNTLGRYGDEHNITLPPRVRLVSSGGAPITLGTMRLFRKMLSADAAFDTTWGATEGLPLTSINIDTLLSETREGMAWGLGTCIGQPIGCVQIRVIKITEGPIISLSKELDMPQGEVGELIVQGPNISQHYHRNEAGDREHKIIEADKVWHRTGDLGWVDKQGQIWFCGRKAHQVKPIGFNKALYSVQAEGVVNSHKSVYRSALVCANIELETESKNRVPVMCVELVHKVSADAQAFLHTEILALMSKYTVTVSIKHVLFHNSFPVDIRHNAKINREQLGQWASQKLLKKTERKLSNRVGRIFLKKNKTNVV